MIKILSTRECEKSFFSVVNNKIVEKEHKDTKDTIFSFKESNQIYMYIKKSLYNSSKSISQGGAKKLQKRKYYDPNTKRFVKFETAVKRGLIKKQYPKSSAK